MSEKTQQAAFSTDSRLRSRCDPFGGVECAGCDEMARPDGGVTYHLQARRVTMVFELPSGWAVQGCALLCRTCARRNGGSF
ncbi:MAG TPA: hypothetical protein VJN18_11205 [Polyangiaceae bacterium]|nr:hypothetical protein [Polyangiaceae bacterium]